MNYKTIFFSLSLMLLSSNTICSAEEKSSKPKINPSSSQSNAQEKQVNRKTDDKSIPVPAPTSKNDSVKPQLSVKERIIKVREKNSNVRAGAIIPPQSRLVKKGATVTPVVYEEYPHSAESPIKGCEVLNKPK